MALFYCKPFLCEYKPKEECRKSSRVDTTRRRGRLLSSSSLDLCPMEAEFLSARHGSQRAVKLRHSCYFEEVELSLSIPRGGRSPRVRYKQDEEASGCWTMP